MDVELTCVIVVQKGGDWDEGAVQLPLLSSACLAGCS